MQTNKVTTTRQIALTIMVAALLLLAPLTKTSGAFFIMEIVGLLMLGILFTQHQWHQSVPLPIRWYLTGSLLTLGMYLIPVPLELWLQLPGRSLYQSSFQLLQQEGWNVSSHTLTIAPYATIQTLLATLPALGIFLVTLNLGRKHTLFLINLVLLLAGFEAILGVIQYAGSGIRAQGTYFNSDHFVALMELTFPLCIGLAAQYFQDREEDIEHHHSWWEQHRTGFYLIAGCIILLGGIFSMSRAGIPLLVMGTWLSAIIFSQYLGGRRSFGLIGILVIITVGAAISIGLIPVVNRFIGEDPLNDGRWAIFKQAWEAIRLFFPLGSGPGSFASVYPLFQPIESLDGLFIDHAHNDYLEFLLETGMVGLFIIGGFLGIFIYRWKNLTQNGQSRFLPTAAGISILLALLHANFDFNFHTIAQPLFLAFLAGLFFQKHQPSLANQAIHVIN